MSIQAETVGASDRINIFHVRYQHKPQYIYFELNNRNIIEGTIVDNSIQESSRRYEFYIDGIYDNNDNIITNVDEIMQILRRYHNKTAMQLFTVQNEATNSFYNIFIDHKYEIVGRMFQQ